MISTNYECHVTDYEFVARGPKTDNHNRSAEYEYAQVPNTKPPMKFYIKKKFSTIKIIVIER
jgi:hypothetical protein